MGWGCRFLFGGIEGLVHLGFVIAGPGSADMQLLGIDVWCGFAETPKPSHEGIYHNSY